MTTTANKRNVATRTPGEAPPAEQMPVQASTDEQTQDTDSGAPKFSEEQQAAIDAEVQRRLEDEMVDEEKKLIVEAEVQRRVKEHRRAAMETAKPVSDLPAQKDIDPKKIKRAVLSRDGYVCPEPTPEKAK
ncbi:MAG: hypothetical protein KKF24_10755 [Gammaproteobacteria bacterium]|nr:hypothetical protein [Gammaproteobacteria bacterium]MBU1833164.1 hypothetical protein [Gammaproteobacteria bacterium]